MLTPVTGDCLPHVATPAGVGAEYLGRGSRRSPGDLWRALIAVAAPQHDLITTAELHAIGICRSSISRHVAARRLHRVYQGVFVVGTPSLTREARWLAAVKACGDGAKLSYLSAACMWKMSRVDPVVIDVSLVGNRRRRDGIRLHRPKVLTDGEWALEAGIPATTPARTWFDLAAVVGTDRLKEMLSTGEREELFDPVRLAATAVAMPRRPGIVAARRMLGSFLPMPAKLRSNLERTFWEQWRAGANPEPELNARLCGEEVDVLWRDRLLVVELDGWRYHRTSVDRARDEARDLKLARAGAQVLRMSDVLIDEDIEGAIRAVLEILDRRPVVQHPPA